MVDPPPIAGVADPCFLSRARERDLVSPGIRKIGGASVPTFDDFSDLERRVRALEARGARNGAEWQPVARSPLGSRKTRRLIAAGKLEASRIGRRLFVRLGDVERLLEARVVERPKPTPAAIANETVEEYVSRCLALPNHGRRRAGGSR